MADHAELIESFYEAFSRRDAEAMVACYHDDVTFSDPVFPNLEGDRAKGMWRMLCEQGKDLSVEYSDIVANNGAGAARWTATYTFSVTGRKVVNLVEADFRFKDGLIVQHNDHFDLWKWTSMALGLPGRLLGWTPLMRGLLRRQVDKALREYMGA
jgi:ketosteroid isomerase-like protein